jgi:glutamate N-acetyltransferase/amino-acid N-acetyltransferase
MSDAVSPLAAPFPVLPPIEGVTVRTVRAGYKNWGRTDLTYVELVEGLPLPAFSPATCAVHRKSNSDARTWQGRARALIVNAGNSNAFTGYRGREAVEAIMDQVSAHLGAPREQVFVSSTGVIGVPLPKDKARRDRGRAGRSPRDMEDAARTIGPRHLPQGRDRDGRRRRQDRNPVGIIKGSGMIAPDMATMLGYVFTDAASRPRSCNRPFRR